ncbi:MAG: hypothetical protein GY715_01570, partial [Planctomycetes bacterium]|nr:hypothetical protein [Planctomycetota bacterium]
VLVGSLQDGFTDAFAIAVSGQTAYVADGAGGMKIVDITDDTAPTITAGESIETTTGTSEDVLLVDQRAYVAAGGAGLAKYEPGNVASRVVYDTSICATKLTRVGDYIASVDIGGVNIFGVEPGGALTPVASESAFRRYRGTNDYSIRLWLGIDAWGDDRIVVANWDSVDVCELVDPAIAGQPDITASSQRIRLPFDGGGTTVRLANQGT